MYFNALSRAKCKNMESNKIEITNGVHQGNVLSPLLLNVFVNDLGDELIDNAVPILQNHKINHLLHADDVVLLSTSNSGLQHNIDMVHKFCYNWGLSINANKSKVIVFSRNRKVKSNIEFRIGQKKLELVRQNTNTLELVLLQMVSF